MIVARGLGKPNTLLTSFGLGIIFNIPIEEQDIDFDNFYVLKESINIIIKYPGDSDYTITVK